MYVSWQMTPTFSYCYYQRLIYFTVAFSFDKVKHQTKMAHYTLKFNHLLITLENQFAVCYQHFISSLGLITPVLSKNKTDILKGWSLDQTACFFSTISGHPMPILEKSANSSYDSCTMDQNKRKPWGKLDTTCFL